MIKTSSLPSIRQMFIDAGVDPAKVSGWVFAKVKTEDKDKQPIEVDKFLKPFSIK